MRVSVTHIDQYIYYKNTEEMTLDDLIERLKPTAEPTEPMKIGTAFHTILETMEGELDEIEQDGYKFKFDLDAEITIPKIQEIKAEKQYGSTTVVGKVDAIGGLMVDDHKTTSQFKVENYADSYQWRLYLDIFGANVFRYNIFSRRENKDGVQVIRALDVLPLHRYPLLEIDVKAMVAEYAFFADIHNIYGKAVARPQSAPASGAVPNVNFDDPPF